MPAKKVEQPIDPQKEWRFYDSDKYASSWLYVEPGEDASTYRFSGNACYASVFHYKPNQPILAARYETNLTIPQYREFMKTKGFPWIPDPIRKTFKFQRLYTRDKKIGAINKAPYKVVGIAYIDTRKISAGNLFALLTWLRHPQEYGGHIKGYLALRTMFPEVPDNALWNYSVWFCQAANNHTNYNLADFNIFSPKAYDVLEQFNFKEKWIEKLKEKATPFFTKLGKEFTLHSVWAIRTPPDALLPLNNAGKLKSYYDRLPMGGERFYKASDLEVVSRNEVSLLVDRREREHLVNFAKHYGVKL